jgi:hypothetical protein
VKNPGTTLRGNELATGSFAILSGLSLIFTILTRFEFISFFSTLNEDLEYLADNLFLLRANSIIWIVTSLIITFTAGNFIILLQPFHKLFSWLTGFFLVLAAAMISVAGIKGLSVLGIYEHFGAESVISREVLKVNIFTLAREKDLYINTSYVLLGFSFLSMGLFALKTRRLSLFTGLVATSTGIILPVFNGIVQQSLFSDIGLVAGCITFMVVGIRLLFSGITKKEDPT